MAGRDDTTGSRHQGLIQNSWICHDSQAIKTASLQTCYQPFESFWFLTSTPGRQQGLLRAVVLAPSPTPPDCRVREDHPAVRSQVDGRAPCEKCLLIASGSQLGQIFGANVMTTILENFHGAILIVHTRKFFWKMGVNSWHRPPS
jgi:hypothetical protein